MLLHSQFNTSLWFMKTRNDAASVMKKSVRKIGVRSNPRSLGVSTQTLKAEKGKAPCKGFETRQILVDTSWNNRDGFKDTKSGDDRIIQIAPKLMELLKELKLQDPKSDFVLPRITK